jgi:hypothetical protein
MIIRLPGPDEFALAAEATRYGASRLQYRCSHAVFNDRDYDVHGQLTIGIPPAALNDLVAICGCDGGLGEPAVANKWRKS